MFEKLLFEVRDTTPGIAYLLNEEWPEHVLIDAEFLLTSDALVITSNERGKRQVAIHAANGYAVYRLPRINREAFAYEGELDYGYVHHD